MGQTGLYQKDVANFAYIEYMRCNLENGFFPNLCSISRPDIIFFCSPNNPTGVTATWEQLTQLVQFAKDNGSTYAMYISSDSPCSIIEIPGAKEVSISLIIWWLKTGLYFDSLTMTMIYSIWWVLGYKLIATITWILMAGAIT